MRTIAMVLFLQWLAILPAVAQDADDDDDPQIGAHRLSEWKKLLCDEDRDTRGSAAVALGKTRAEAGTPLLIKALDDKHWSVPGKAAYGLGLNATDDAIEALIRTIKNDRKNGDLRGDAAFALGIACRRNRKYTEKAIPRAHRRSPDQNHLRTRMGDARPRHCINRPRGRARIDRGNQECE